MAPPVEEGPKNTARRDMLLDIQKQSQGKWTDTKVFEVNAPTDVASSPDNKFFGNFPYPYMNGMLHLGHAFSLSKLEFAAAYQRMKGKHTLFPFAFHCTGMPIKAAADKIERECERFGCPPAFPSAMEVDEAPKEEEAASQADKDPAKFKGKKTKAAAKAGTEVYQWNILKSSGIPEEDLPKFRKAEYWLEYFPPLGKRDVQAMGCQVDWRRSFITTDFNPYYDAFIRWHLNSLRKHNKVIRAKRFAVYSPLDGQPCADHDRATGEGVGPQDYVLIKMEALAYPGKLAQLEGRKVFLCAATLRAETMYGQTNYWVLPDGEYGAYLMANGEVYVVTPRAARNLSFQDHTNVYGQSECLCQLKGWDLLGLPVRAPNAFNEVIYGLPMLTVLTTKGTGVVTSVPSDAPDDYMALQDLKKKPAMREKFGIKDEWVMPFEVVPIINIPEFGDQSAVTVCEELKIQSQNDRAKLDEAKNRTYLKGFYEGVMLVGGHKGATVQEAKPLIRDEMVAAGQAIVYSEPEKPVLSRSGDDCVVALTDQWYLTYGEEEWQAKAVACLERMECYSKDTKQAFLHALGWLKQWALSRSFGLGTRLPWDPEFLIESLSDSTIYMAYYTIAHILQEGDMFGQGAHPIPASEMTDAVFDHIFLDEPCPPTAIPAAVIAKMKSEFNFWYPYDLRVSGKDLIQNHLSFSIYNHTAIFPEKHWPRSFRCNGHLLLNGEKMSKSTGNFLTLKQAIEEFSADAMRIALADAGDGLDDANFVDKTANASILRLTKELAWIEECLAEGAALRAGPPSTFADRVFSAAIDVAIATTTTHYDAMNFREALKFGWYELQTARDTYRMSVGPEGMNHALVLRFVEVQTLLMVPIAPHTMDYVWSKLLKREGCAVAAPFPSVALGDEQVNLVMAGAYLQEEITSMRGLIQKMETPKKPRKGQPAEKAGKVTAATLYVKPQFDGWHAVCLGVLREKFSPAAKEFAKDTEAAVLAALAADPSASASVQGGEKMLKKLAMPFVQFKKAEAINVGPHVLKTTLPFDEKTCLEENSEFICRSLNIASFTVHLYDSPAALAAPETAKVATALPGTPAHSFDLAAADAPAASAAAKAPAGYSFVYFDFEARGEACRIALHEAKLAFQDLRLDGPALLKGKAEGKYTTGLPVLTTPFGQTFSQSVAILRFAGKMGSLYPQDPLAALAVDEVMDVTQDILTRCPQDPNEEEKKRKRAEYAGGKMKGYMDLISARVAKGPFVLGSALSVADLFLFYILKMIRDGTFDYVEPTYVDQWPALVKLEKALVEHPVFKAYKARKP